MNLRALGESVLVEEAPQRVATLSGIDLPVAWRKATSTGWVISIGPEAARRVPELKPHMTVCFRPYAGLIAGKPIEWNGKKYRKLYLEDFIGVIGEKSVSRIEAE